MAFVKKSLASIGGTPVGSVGYGLMGLTMPWAPIDYPVAVGLMKAALDQGANLWNGGIHYGTPAANSLHLLHHYFTLHPSDASRVVLSIKGALSPTGQPMGTREAIRASVEEAVRVLACTKPIDVFEMARVDPAVAIETSVHALAELVQEGKIKGIGLSEVSAKTIRRAHAVHPIAAVEVEMSLCTPDPLRNGIAETCRELNIPIIAYSPLGRGQLSSSLRSLTDLPEDDFRRKYVKPRFAAGAFEQNFRLVEAVEGIAKRKGVSTTQMALAWVVKHGAIPIPGSGKMERVVENSKAVELTDGEMRELERAMRENPVVGERYGGAHEALLNA